MQRELLATAVRLARPETRIMYSTCSLEREENGEIGIGFGGKHPDWRLVKSGLTFPNGEADLTTWRDGGFHAVWQHREGAVRS
jgi:16S rRNA (cytosine967-C5)-methyltransferase